MLPNCELKLWNNPEVKEFVRFVKSELSHYGMKLIFGRGVEVNIGGFRSSGYFDEREIRVARRCPDWLTVLVHEYSHFLQWKHRKEEYEDMFINNVDSLKIINEWMDGQEFRPSTIKKAFIKARRMEKKCEMMALEVIRRYGLPINTEKFIRQANCHIYYYHMMEKTRKRFVKNEMFYCRALERIIPKTFNCNNIHHIPEKVYQLALKTF